MFIVDPKSMLRTENAIVTRVMTMDGSLELKVRAACHAAHVGGARPHAGNPVPRKHDPCDDIFLLHKIRR